MSLKQWLDKGRLQQVSVTPKTLEDLLALIARDIEDAKIKALSNDRRFATAYNAALNLCSYVVRTQGYRIAAKPGHHQLTFEAAGFVLDSSAAKYLDFFDLCRRKRNKVDYDLAGVVSETEVDALIEAVIEFKALALEKP